MWYSTLCFLKEITFKLTVISLELAKFFFISVITVLEPIENTFTMATQYGSS